MIDNSRDLFLVPEEESDIEQEYRKAVAILWDVKAYARRLARSGNPGRSDAGRALLSLLEPQK